MTITICFAESEAEREAIYRLRYRIYVEELGAISFPGADHERRWLGEGGVRNSRLLYAELGGEVVATLRLQLGADDALTEDDAIIYDFARFEGHLGMEQLCVLSRFMALPEHRGGQIPQLMLQAMYRFCVAQGLAICFLDCRPHLINLYQRLGFRSYGRPYSEPGYGLLIPMALQIDDCTHLAAVESPFLKNAPPVPVGRQTTGLAALLCDEQPAVRPSNALTLDTAPVYISGLTDEGRSPIGLFSGFDQVELARLVAHGYVLTCRQGDKLIIDGDVEHSMFLILSGHVEARVGNQVVAVEGPGSVIGEVAYLLRGPRTADVVAAEDGVRVLYFRYQTVEALMHDEPHLAARLLLNLSRVIATKLLAKYR
jgi:CRP-like cAMP-binding protein/predicted GNAT family N-acyltransferase